jgi:hypothetical protein
MDYSNFIILLARQRSGTNALRSVFETHPDVFCLNEVFSLANKDSEDPFLRQTNFFNFLTKRVNWDVRAFFPDHHEELFLDFLEYLRCFSPKRYIVIDVKYNSVHILLKPFLESMSWPYLFELIMKHHLRVLNLRRRHYLRYILSVQKAFDSRRYSLTPDDSNYSDPVICLDPTYVLLEIEKCYHEDQFIEKRFASYDARLLADYAELFPDTSGRVSDTFLQRFSEWLGIPRSFENRAGFKKQSYLPLAQTLETFDKVADALRGTMFEYCIDDEAAYRHPKDLSL